MKMNAGKFFAILVVCFQCEAQKLYPIIADYLLDYNIKLCYFFTCWTDRESVRMITSLSRQNVRSIMVKSRDNIIDILEDEIVILKYGHILDVSCPEYSKILTNSSELNFRETRPWLIFTTSADWQQIFDDVKLRLDSNVKILFQDGQSLKFFDIYNPGYHLGARLVIIPGKNKQSMYTQRRNLTGLKLRAGSVTLNRNHPGTFDEHMWNLRKKEEDTLSKSQYPIFKMLVDVHNFTHSLHLEHQWFGDLPNGTDGGVARCVYENIVDLAITACVLRVPRIDYYDYLMPCYRFRPRYIFRNPGIHNPFSNQFLEPFSNSSWYVTIITAAIICVLLKTFHRLESRLVYSWATSILMTAATIFQQASSVFPRAMAGKTVFLVLQFWSLLLYNYYTSSILSSLLNSPPKFLRTLDELGQSSLEIGVEDVPYVWTFFGLINDSDVQYIYKNKVTMHGKRNTFTTVEGLERVRRGGFAYHTQLDSAYPLIERTFDQDAICDLRTISMMPQSSAGLMVGKKSQYGEMFHVTLRMIRTAGLVQKFLLIWESADPECLSSVRAVAVDGAQTLIAFLTLAMGMVIALLFLVMEILWNKFNLDKK